MKKNVIFLLLSCCIGILDASAQKKILDTADYKKWNTLDIPVISRNGEWVLYHESKAAESTHLFQVKTGKNIVISKAKNSSFFDGGQWLKYAKGADSTILYRLKDGKTIVRSRKQYFNESSWTGNLIYKRNADLVIVNIERGDSAVIEKVDRYTLYGQDQNILYVNQGKLMAGPLEGKKKLIAGNISDYFFNPDLKSGTYLSGTKLFYFSLLKDSPAELLDFAALQAPEGKKVVIKAYDFNPESRDLVLDMGSDRANIQNSRIKPDNKSAKKAQPGFDLELWTWDEPVSQRLQKKGAAAKQQPKQAVFIYHLDTKSWFEISAQYSGLTSMPKADELPYVIVADPNPYILTVDYRYTNNVDLYSLDTRTGKKSILARDSYTMPQWGPNGNYAVLYDKVNRKWNVFDPKNGSLKPFSGQIGYPVYDEDHDMPRPAEAYGLAGWTNGGNSVVLYDRYDLWEVDLKGTKETWSLTGAYGRRNHIQFRLQGSDFYEDLDLSRPLLFTSFNENTKAKGLYRLLPNHQIAALYNQKDFSVKIIAAAANGSFVYSKQNYSTFPDIWWADANFKAQKCITDVNPQQKDYQWGSAKVVEWKTFDGKRNQGLLYLPDNYDPKKSYPTIVDFYEILSSGLHEYFPPLYSTAVINIPTYLSQGYIVFRPDVHFKVGDPGESAYNCVVSGTQYLIDQKIIDPKRVGLQGHSWSGYEAAYIVTRTPMFTCANLGAAVVNMTYNYFAIRANGAPCLFKYEVEQSRIGKNLWEDTDAYLRNSPIFKADKIETPLLIFHNDKDGAVAFTQGLDLFLAMRRLGKPAWLLNYKGEGHTLSLLPAQQDWTLRMQQFFDHYLKQAPEPRWMKEGINVDERGIDEKYDF